MLLLKNADYKRRVATVGLRKPKLAKSTLVVENIPIPCSKHFNTLTNELGKFNELKELDIFFSTGPSDSFMVYNFASFPSSWGPPDDLTSCQLKGHFLMWEQGQVTMVGLSPTQNLEEQFYGIALFHESLNPDLDHMSCFKERRMSHDPHAHTHTHTHIPARP